MKPSATATENEKVADPVHGDNTDDAARWWRAYQLAENDQVDELRRLAAAGDDHARRQLASWLSDRAFPGGPGPGGLAKVEEAIEVIRPLANAGDDVAELWLARWLADCDRLDELRERAGNGGYHASRELARLLADHDLLDELRDRISTGGDHYALRQLARRLIERDMSEELRELVEAADADTRPLILDAAGGASSQWMNAMRVLADFGHKASRMCLARTLAREGRLEELRQRAGNGDEYAQHWLQEALGRLARQRDVIAYLVEAGADPNPAAAGGVTPLHRAVRNRCSAAVEGLLRAGADPRLPNDRGSTASDLAHWTTGRGGAASEVAKAEQRIIIELLGSTTA